MPTRSFISIRCRKFKVIGIKSIAHSTSDFRYYVTLEAVGYNGKTKILSIPLTQDTVYTKINIQRLSIHKQPEGNIMVYTIIDPESSIPKKKLRKKEDCKEIVYDKSWSVSEKENECIWKLYWNIQCENQSYKKILCRTYLLNMMNDELPKH